MDIGPQGDEASVCHLPGQRFKFNSKPKFTLSRQSEGGHIGCVSTQGARHQPNFPLDTLPDVF